jgi:mRNA-degrading endonuclease toxin of MazEF toxin-antitoxin module
VSGEPAASREECLALLADRLGATVVAEYLTGAAVIALPYCLTNTAAAALSLPPTGPLVIDGTAHLQTVDARATQALGRRLAGRDVYLAGLPATFIHALTEALSAAESTPSESRAAA